MLVAELRLGRTRRVGHSCRRDSRFATRYARIIDRPPLGERQGRRQGFRPGGPPWPRPAGDVSESWYRLPALRSVSALQGSESIILGRPTNLVSTNRFSAAAHPIKRPAYIEGVKWRATNAKSDRVHPSRGASTGPTTTTPWTSSMHKGRGSVGLGRRGQQVPRFPRRLLGGQPGPRARAHPPGDGRPGRQRVTLTSRAFRNDQLGQAVRAGRTR